MRKAPELDRISRISISLPTLLLEEIDSVSREMGFDNRSQAIAEMMQSQLVLHRQHFGNQEMVGSITLVYDAERKSCGMNLTLVQREFRKLILGSSLFHIDDVNQMETISVRGEASELKKLSDRLISCKGVKSGKLNLATTIVEQANASLKANSGIGFKRIGA